jgi:nucleoside-diphosphate-sugar epimerase
MNVLITGATGFIGSHLAERLHAKGHSLRCLVRPTSDLRWIRHLPVEYIYGDLFDERALTSAVRDVDYIYHLAGVTKARTPEEYFKGNHDATSNLLAVVRSNHAKLQRFIQVSSQTAVGPSSAGAVVNEESLYRPITTYVKSKMAAKKESLNAMKELLYHRYSGGLAPLTKTFSNF